MKLTVAVLRILTSYHSQNAAACATKARNPYVFVIFLALTSKRCVDISGIRCFSVHHVCPVHPLIATPR
jgi:hypothetical protein